MKFKNSKNEWQPIKVKNYGIEQTPIGSMIYYPSQIIPKGYLVCDGSELLITDYPELFKAIGYIGGSTANSGYFKLPDMRGKVPGGYDSSLSGTANPLAGNFGDNIGKATHKLTLNELPKHAHGENISSQYGYEYPAVSNNSNGSEVAGYLPTYTGTEVTKNQILTSDAGGNEAHAIVQPTMLYHWLIKAKNTTTLGGYVEDFMVDGELSVNNLKINDLIVIDNLNDTNLKTGFYYCMGGAIGAPHSSAWTIQVLRKLADDGDLVITQIAYRYRDNEIWVRQYNALSPAGWKDWYPITQDTGWQSATLTSDFVPYNNSQENTPKYRKIGKVVELGGIVAPSQTIPGSNSATIIFTLPVGYRPSMNKYFICQGSGRNVWLLNVYPKGTVTLARYGTSASSDVPTSAWLPFNATFFID